MPSWRIGSREASEARAFMQDLASRLKHRVQLTTYGHRPYLEAVEGAFGADVDYAMLVKLYGRADEERTGARYSPGECRGTRTAVVTGSPDAAKIGTSYAERSNLTMRMSVRRYTRLTNAFSKALNMHAHAVALHYMVYNYVRINRMLRVTPAMAAGVTDRLWEISDLVDLLETREREGW